jgi:hypothetical protein
MATAKFLSKVAFICNICFLIANALLWEKNPPRADWLSLVIIMGYVMAVFMNAGALISYLYIRFWGEHSGYPVPIWLIIINCLFFLIQLILFLS